ncbi:MAG TPA: MaoC family dehydratase [Myxococcales bacterium]|nr:MaoC family dehydratase [Myxococcales bacterium]
MAKVRISQLEDLRKQIGREVAVGEWLTVTQERIDLFAEATEDRQWIHVDPARAKAESPFGGTVAHGFLTLSLLPRLSADTVELPPARLTVNYGLNKVRFPAPVRAGQRIRAHFTPKEIEEVPSGVQLTWTVTIELEGSDKPACVAETVSRRYA